MTEQVQGAGPGDFEKPTQPRYSLAYPEIGSQDILLQHPTGSVRIVTYEKGDSWQIGIQEKLLEHGLIVGSVVSEADDDIQGFRVPASARPISYDASVRSTGSFSYNDEQLFYDLGCILGELFGVAEEQPVLTGDIGHSIALVEFTQPNQRQLYFVPGVEKVISPLGHDISPVNYYAGKLHDAFGGRFDASALSFRMGFADITSEGERGE
jgi:hypothetical protein